MLYNQMDFQLLVTENQEATKILLLDHIPEPNDKNLKINLYYLMIQFRRKKLLSVHLFICSNSVSYLFD